MHRPELTGASPAFAREVERIALPLDIGRAGTSGFGSLMNEVRGEVATFIANGSSTMSAIGLSAEGGVQRARLQGAGQSVDAQQRDFLASIAPWARDAADRLGVSPDLVAAHAALESGWGQQPLRNADGSSTNNLFGVKASGGWNGKVANAMTTEVVDGIAAKQPLDFRSYADAATGFRDYAQMLLDNPRYRGALNAGGDAQAFAAGLVEGSYATDPNYANKLENVARRVRELGVSY